MERYPIDTDELRKGDEITIEMIEKAMSTHRDADSYWKHQLAIKSFVAKDILARRGEVITIKGEGLALRILTDAEASEYNPRQFDNAVGRAARAHHRNLHVDDTALDTRASALHLRNLEVQGKMLQEAMRARHEIALKPAERQSPGLPAGDGGEGE